MVETSAAAAKIRERLYSQAPKRAWQPYGLEKPGTHATAAEKILAAQQRPTQQINPQKAGYDPAAPKRQRRVTQAEIIRKRNRRRAMSILAVLAVLAVGAFVSLNLLFKVAFFRVENFDRTPPPTPASTPRTSLSTR